MEQAVAARYAAMQSRMSDPLTTHLATCAIMERAVAARYAAVQSRTRPSDYPLASFALFGSEAARPANEWPPPAGLALHLQHGAAAAARQR